MTMPTHDSKLVPGDDADVVAMERGREEASVPGHTVAMPSSEAKTRASYSGLFLVEQAPHLLTFRNARVEKDFQAQRLSDWRRVSAGIVGVALLWTIANALVAAFVRPGPSLYISQHFLYLIRDVVTVTGLFVVLLLTATGSALWLRRRCAQVCFVVWITVVLAMHGLAATDPTTHRAMVSKAAGGSDNVSLDRLEAHATELSFELSLVWALWSATVILIAISPLLQLRFGVAAIACGSVAVITVVVVRAPFSVGTSALPRTVLPTIVCFGTAILVLTLVARAIESALRGKYAAGLTLAVEHTRKKEARARRDAADRERRALVQDLEKTTRLIQESELRLGPKLGQGRFGDAYLAQYRGHGMAVVKVSKASDDVTDLRSLLSMINLEPHPNVLRLLGVTKVRSRFATVCPYYPSGSLDRLHSIADLAAGSVLARIAHDLFRGVAHLHANGVIHRDIACRNVFLDSSGTVVLGDWGLAVDFCSDNGGIHLPRGELPPTGVSWPWAAPESLKHGAFAPSSDVWMAGVTLWELMTRGAAPYEWVRRDQSLAIAKIVQGTLRLAVPTTSGQRMQRVVMRCLDRRPAKRPTAAKLARELAFDVGTAASAVASCSSAGPGGGDVKYVKISQTENAATHTTARSLAADPLSAVGATSHVVMPGVEGSIHSFRRMSSYDNRKVDPGALLSSRDASVDASVAADDKSHAASARGTVLVCHGNTPVSPRSAFSANSAPLVQSPAFGLPWDYGGDADTRTGTHSHVDSVTTKYGRSVSLSPPRRRVHVSVSRARVFERKRARDAAGSGLAWGWAHAGFPGDVLAALPDEAMPVTPRASLGSLQSSTATNSRATNPTPLLFSSPNPLVVASHRRMSSSRGSAKAVLPPPPPPPPLRGSTKAKPAMMRIRSAPITTRRQFTWRGRPLS